MGRLFTDQGGSALRVNQTYDAYGRISTQTRSTNGTVVSTSATNYDFAGHIVSIVAKDGAGALVDDFESAFDAAGQLTSQTDNGQTQTYNYDLIGQLTGDGSHAYGYDANGNRNVPVRRIT